MFFHLNNKTVHVVAGPTASGKTDKAINLARRFNGELINVDSRQIYKYLDIGTNKGDVKKIEVKPNETIEFNNENLPVYAISKTNFLGINSSTRIHLLSFLNPDQPFNAFEFRELVYAAIKNILGRGKTPILVGGSGLYLDVIIDPTRYGQRNDIDPEQREQLNSLNLEDLQNQLKEIDPEALNGLNNSDRNNPRRLIRLIEKLSSVGGKDDDNPAEKSAWPQYEFGIHYQDVDMSQLEEKINQRVEKMFADGLVNEVIRVMEMGFPEASIALQGIGYREVLRLLNKEITGKECIKLVQIAHRQYAKRQITWFKKYLLGR